jgi:hypothetical protein
VNFVKLDVGEQAVARLLAEQRYTSNRIGGVVNARIGCQSDAMTDLNGIGGELAFCRVVNVWPDLSINPRHGGADCVTMRGYRVDVKTSSHEDAQLIAHRGKSLGAADVYVLVVGTFPLYRIVGWAWAAELIRADRLTDLGYGLTYALPQRELRPVSVPWPGMIADATLASVAPQASQTTALKP